MSDFRSVYNRGLTLEERFWQKVVKTDTCWNWIGARDSRGYGLIYLAKGKRDRAHRVSFSIARGRAVVEGKVIDHLCRNTSCVNPEHLEEVTHRTNARRGTSPGAVALRRDACSLGHPFDEWGTYVMKRRVCRLCRAAYMAEYNLARKEGRWPLSIDLESVVAAYVAGGHHLKLALTKVPGVPRDHHGLPIPAVA